MILDILIAVSLITSVVLHVFYILSRQDVYVYVVLSWVLTLSILLYAIFNTLGIPVLIFVLFFLYFTQVRPYLVQKQKKNYRERPASFLSAMVSILTSNLYGLMEFINDIAILQSLRGAYPEIVKNLEEVRALVLSNVDLPTAIMRVKQNCDVQDVSVVLTILKQIADFSYADMNNPLTYDVQIQFLSVHITLLNVREDVKEMLRQGISNMDFARFVSVMSVLIVNYILYKNNILVLNNITMALIVIELGILSVLSVVIELVKKIPEVTVYE